MRRRIALATAASTTSVLFAAAVAANVTGVFDAARPISQVRAITVESTAVPTTMTTAAPPAHPTVASLEPVVVTRQEFVDTLIVVPRSAAAPAATTEPGAPAPAAGARSAAPAAAAAPGEPHTVTSPPRSGRSGDDEAPGDDLDDD